LMLLNALHSSDLSVCIPVQHRKKADWI
jgi:hypothetical protein